MRGHEVHFITYANPIRLDPDTPRIHYHEVEVSNYPLFQYPPYCLALAGRMAEVAESYNLDVLHVHYAIPHSIAAWGGGGERGAETNARACPPVPSAFRLSRGGGGGKRGGPGGGPLPYITPLH